MDCAPGSARGGVDMKRVNVFVVGLEEHNLEVLAAMPGSDQYRFHPVLSYEEIYRGPVDFERSLAEAQRVLDAAVEPIDTIIGFWDFPVSSLVPLLRRRYGLPAVPLEELLMCEHKYWSRLVQQEVIEEYPAFALVDPRRAPLPPPGVNFPMWLKPVKSYASVLAFGVADAEAYATAIGLIRRDIEQIAAPFDALLKHVDLPQDVAGVGGQMCLAEEAMVGRQVTIEGYRFAGEVVVYGVVDSIRHANSPSFARFQYPSSLPGGVVEEMSAISRVVVERIGLESMPFNIEFFWDPGTGAVKLLEINPRHSQSHARLFADVDGIANHHVALQLSLGHDPRFPRRHGPYPIAAKCFVRRFGDGVVRRHPAPAEIAAIEQSVPGATVVLTAVTGDVLSQVPKQDSYSYALASVYVAAGSETELLAKFDQVTQALTFEIEDV